MRHILFFLALSISSFGQAITHPLSKAQLREQDKRFKVEQKAEQYQRVRYVDWYSAVPFMPGAYLLLTVKGSSSVVVQPRLADNTPRETIVVKVPSGEVGQVRVDLNCPIWNVGWLQITVDRNATMQASYELLVEDKLVTM